MERRREVSIADRIATTALWAVLAGWVAAAGVATADENPLPDPSVPGLSLAERSSALIDRIQLEQKRLTALEADFTQRRESEFLAAPEESRGSFAYSAPDLVRWDYLEPKPVAMVIRDNEMLTWYKDLGKAERLKVGRVSSQVFRYLNASGSLESLMRYFAVTVVFPKEAAEPYRLDLLPRYARIQKRLSAMSLWIDRALFLPVQVRYVEPNGDLTEYRFANLKRNGAILASRFELELPQGVEVKVIDLDRGGPAEP